MKKRMEKNGFSRVLLVGLVMIVAAMFAVACSNPLTEDPIGDDTENSTDNGDSDTGSGGGNGDTGDGDTGDGDTGDGDTGDGDTGNGDTGDGDTGDGDNGEGDGPTPPKVIGIEPSDPPDPNGPITWPNSQEYQLLTENDDTEGMVFHTTEPLPEWITLDETTGAVDVTTEEHLAPGEVKAHTAWFYTSFNDGGSTLNDTFPWTFTIERGAAVYVAGYRNDGTRNVAVYWVDDGDTITHHELQPGVAGEATDIHVDADGVVRAVGWYRDGSTDIVAFWRNGVVTPLESGGKATGMHVTETGVTYVSGYYHNGTRNVAAYWVVDGDTVTRVDLHTTSAARATGIVVDGDGGVYVSGFYDNGSHDVAVYWTHAGGVVSVVELYTTAFAQANVVFVDAGIVYAGGTYRDGPLRAAVWRDDGAEIEITTLNGLNVRGLHVSGGSFAASGDHLDTDSIRRAAAWSDTEITVLYGATPAMMSFGYSLAFAGERYVAGYQTGAFDQAVYWRETDLVELSADTASRSSGLFVRR